MFPVRALTFPALVLGCFVLRYFFRKTQRLLKNEQFQAVLAHRCYAHQGMLRFYAAPNDGQGRRLGISVSRTCGNAVLRNQVKRLTREVVSLNHNIWPYEHDYLLIIKQKMTKQHKSQKVNKRAEIQGKLRIFDYSQMEKSFLDLARRLGKQHSTSD